jgi:WD40 repeat protein
MACEHVIFLTFADARGDLPWLREERRRLKTLFERFEKEGRCSLLFEPDSSWDQIYHILTTQPDDIAIFHFGGHAREGQVLLDSHLGATPVEAEGLAALLGRRQNLKLVFLNGCSTRPQVQLLLDAGVPTVIATARPIDDRAACDISVAFYESLTAGGELDPAGGRSVRAAFDASRSYVIGLSKSGSYPRDFVAEDRPHTIHDVADGYGLPWDLFVRPGAEHVERWDLFADDPLFGLPELPKTIGLPADPFRNLDWFGEEHARIFFGRGRSIRELHDLIGRSASPGNASVILYFGQTGVGKTSVLAAGIVPRLRAKFQVRYRRRDPALGLLGTLGAELAPGSDQFDLGQSWRDIEMSDPDRPLVFILDQVEEAYTRPLSSLVPNDGSIDRPASELANPEVRALFEAVRSAFALQRPDRLRGKLILGLRTEWLGELEKACRAYQLAYEPTPLSALDRAGVIEAVEGIVREPDLAAKWAHYRLTITPSKPTLAQFMADDLRDRLGRSDASEGSPIAPTLQLLLTRLWEVARARGDGDRVFDAKLYDDMKSKGFKLDEVLTKQLSEIEGLGGDESSQRLGEAATNGLLLDLLEAFTTPLGTAATRTKPDLYAQYRLQRTERIDALLDQCKNRYLIAEVKVANGETAYRLSHDILAPLIRERFRTSIRPAQRARRLLESRAAEWAGKPEGPVLDRTDLRAAEDGVRWMRRLEHDESRLLDASRQAEEQRVADEEERQRRLRLAEEEAKRELEQRLEAQEAAKEQAEARLRAEELAGQALQGRLEARKSALRKSRSLVQKIKSAYRQLRKAFAALAVSLVSVVFIASFAGYEWGQEVKQRGIAEEKSKLARTQEGFAKEQARIARQNEAEAKKQTEIAKDQERRADEKARLAESRRISALSESERDRRLVQAFLLAAEALAIDSTAEARNALFKAFVARPQLTSFLHTEEGHVASVAFSPDGKTVAAGYAGTSSVGGGVVLFDASRHERLQGQPLAVTEGSISSVAFSPDGKTVAAGYDAPRGGVVLFDVIRHERLQGQPLAVTEGSVSSVAFGPDGSTLAAGYDGAGGGGVVLFDATRGERLQGQPLAVPEGYVSGVAFSPDGKTLAAGISTAVGGGVVLFDATRRERFQGQPLSVGEGYVSSLAISPDRTNLAAGYFGVGGSGVVLFDWTLRERRNAQPLVVTEGYVRSVAFSPDGKTLAVGYNGARGSGVVLLAATRREWHRAQDLSVTEGYVSTLAVSPDGRTLAAGFSAGVGGGVVLFDPTRHQRLQGPALPVTEGYVRSVAFSPDGKTLAAGYDDAPRGGVVLFDAIRHERRDAEPLVVMEGSVSRVAFGADGNTVAVVYGSERSSSLVLFDATPGGRHQAQLLSVMEGRVLSVTFSADCKSLAAGYVGAGGGGIVLFDAIRRERRHAQPLVVMEGSVSSVAFSPGGNALAAGYIGARRGGVVLFDPVRGERLQGQPLAVPEGFVSSVAFSPNAKALAFGCGGGAAADNGVIFFDLMRQKRLQVQPFPLRESGVVDLVFSPDGNTLVALYDSQPSGRGLLLFDAASRQWLPSQPLTVTDGVVESVAFSPDGKTMAAGYGTSGRRGGVVVYDFDLESWQRQAGQIANRNLTRAEWRQYFSDQAYRATFPKSPVPPEEEPNAP